MIEFINSLSIGLQLGTSVIGFNEEFGIVTVPGEHEVLL